MDCSLVVLLRLRLSLRFLSFFSFFFFFSYRDLRVLHSFPTRRSSDLAPRSHRSGVPGSRAPRDCAGGARRPPRGDPPLLPRSEEHTSELQSRGHLVCRLLLEIKKIGDCIRLLSL